MKELSFEQIKEVKGGHPAAVVAVGAIGGAIAAAQNGGGVKGALTGAALGAAAAGAGVMGAITKGVVKVGWYARSALLTGASGKASDSGSASE